MDDVRSGLFRTTGGPLSCQQPDDEQEDAAHRSKAPLYQGLRPREEVADRLHWDNLHMEMLTTSLKAELYEKHAKVSGSTESWVTIRLEIYFVGKIRRVGFKDICIHGR